MCVETFLYGFICVLVWFLLKIFKEGLRNSHLVCYILGKVVKDHHKYNQKLQGKS